MGMFMIMTSVLVLLHTTHEHCQITAAERRCYRPPFLWASISSSRLLQNMHLAAKSHLQSPSIAPLTYLYLHSTLVRRDVSRRICYQHVLSHLMNHPRICRYHIQITCIITAWREIKRRVVSGRVVVRIVGYCSTIILIVLLCVKWLLVVGESLSTHTEATR